MLYDLGEHQDEVEIEAFKSHRLLWFGRANNRLELLPGRGEKTLVRGVVRYVVEKM